MARMCETSLRVALMCVIALASANAIAAEDSISKGTPQVPSATNYGGSFSSGPNRGPPHHESPPPPPPPPKHGVNSFGSFYSGPYHGPPLYEVPPPPPSQHSSSSSFGSFYSGPYHGPPLYEIPPPPPSSL